MDKSSFEGIVLLARTRSIKDLYIATIDGDTWKIDLNNIINRHDNYFILKDKETTYYIAYSSITKMWYYGNK